MMHRLHLVCNLGFAHAYYLCVCVRTQFEFISTMTHFWAFVLGYVVKKHHAHKRQNLVMYYVGVYLLLELPALVEVRYTAFWIIIWTILNSPWLQWHEK